jgi:hypothetical protein
MNNINNIRRNAYRFALVPASALTLILAAAGCSNHSAGRAEASSEDASYTQSTSYESDSYRSARVAGDVSQRRAAMSVPHNSSPEEDLAAARPGITGSATAVEAQWSQTRPGIGTVPHAGEMDADTHPYAGMNNPPAGSDNGQFSARRTNDALSGDSMHGHSRSHSPASYSASPSSSQSMGAAPMSSSRPVSIPVSTGNTPEEDLAETPAGYATTNEPEAQEVWAETDPGFETVPAAGDLDGPDATYEF